MVFMCRDVHILCLGSLEPKVDVFQEVKDENTPQCSAYDATTRRSRIGISSQLKKYILCVYCQENMICLPL